MAAAEDLSSLHVAIVGAGVMGVHTALLLSRRGARVTVLEREDGAGGVWLTQANAGSRVQVAEPGYRLIPERELTDFTERPEVLSTLSDAVEMVRAAGGRVVYGASVERVRNTGDAVSITYRQGGREESVAADHAMLCVGGLQVPRRIDLPGEDRFRGPVVYGVAGAPDAVDVKGKRVLVLGMGAFGVENARECLFRGAEHVTILARNRNQVVAKLWMYMAFAQPENFLPARELEQARRRAAGATAPPGAGARPGAPPPDIGAVMVHAYRACGALGAMPDELREFARTKDPRAMQHRESFGTVPTGSDAFFIGHALGRLSTVRGEVARVLPDGVETADGARIAASVIIKNVGFEDPDAWVAPVVGQSHMHSPMVINERVWLCKCERARMTLAQARKEGRAAFGDMLNIPPVAPAIAATFTELFCYFQARPARLRALVDSGALPRVEIGGCTGLTWSRGQWAMMNADPDLAQRVNACRRQIAVDMTRRWTFSEYFRENRAWWRYCCRRMSGNEESVPYLWAHMEPLFKMLDRAAAARRAGAPPRPRL